MSSPKVIRYQNGVPNKELQDQFAGQINIPDSIQTDPNKIPANLRFQDILAQQGKKAQTVLNIWPTAKNC